MTMYQEVSTYYTRRRSKTLQTYGFLPLDEETNSTSQKATDFVFNNFPRQFHHQIVRDFWIYFLIKDIATSYNELYDFAKKENTQTKTEKHKYEEGKSYPNIDDERIGVEYRMNLKDKYSFCSVILMTNYFVMLKDTTV